MSDVYELFNAELDLLAIRADMPAAAVVGECIRAVKRAQMAFDSARPPGVRGEPGELRERIALALDEDHREHGFTLGFVEHGEHRRMADLILDALGFA
jgi:hypothetical protein